MMQSKHILVKSAFDDKDANRWYDNPDLADVLFAIFNNEEFHEHTICLKTYKAGVGGFHSFRLNEDALTASFVSSSSKPLAGKILYHPVLTLSTTNPHFIQQELDGILNGIDKGEDGMPRLILISVLMHRNHFGIIAIEPDKAQVIVSYFNSKGTMRSYKDEEQLIFSYLQQRYISANLIHNGEYVYQLDGDSCGPFVTEFATKATRLAIASISPSNEFVPEGQHCGMEVLDAYGSTKARVLEIRQEHAKHLTSFKTNYTFVLFTQCAEELVSIKDGTLPKGAFQHIGLESSPQKRCGMFPTLDNIVVRKLDGHDVFEMQPALIDWFMQRAAVISEPISITDKNFVAKDMLPFYEQGGLLLVETPSLQPVGNIAEANISIPQSIVHNISTMYNNLTTQIQYWRQ